MNIKSILLGLGLTCVAFQPLCALADSGKMFEVKAPDKHMSAQFKTDDNGQLQYAVYFNDAPLISWSRLGLQGVNFSLADHINITGIEKVNHKGAFDWPLGEEARIDNTYNGAVLHCSASGRKFDVDVRLYNGSVAFRYHYQIAGVDAGKTVHLKQELTEFNFTNDVALYQYHEESVFRKVQLSNLNGISDFPTTIVTPGHLFVSIGEAENRNYTKGVLMKNDQSNGLKVHTYLDTIYRNHIPVSITRDTDLVFRDSLVSPWRTISCATSAVGLHNFSELNLKLTTPADTQTPQGIRPGKVFRVPISTIGALNGIDFAQQMNFQYILIDAGWYGAEFRTVSNPLKPIDGFDVKHIIDYGRSKGIGVILYVNYVGLRAKIDSILPLYKSWGVSGIKFGFVDGGTQKGLSWLDTAMMKVNNYGMILNVHDHYKPTGLSRRYPYNLSQEGIRGDENSPDAFHTTVLPFTRYLAGPADFTFCFPNSKSNFAKNLLVSKAQQLALTVVYFDPLQAIFWYGKSEDYAVGNELEFFRRVPTVWDESRYLAGEIGEYITVARRKGDTWYLGTAVGLQSINTSAKLDFLDKKRSYHATVYEDDNRGGIVLRSINVKNGDALPLNLKAKSGQAVIIELVDHPNVNAQER